MSGQKLNFIVIDDSKLDRFIVEKMINTTGKSDQVTTFGDAREALNFIMSGSYQPAPKKTVIIVDIQMPFMNGFEFVEAFETLKEEVTGNYKIFILSSTINQSDLNRVSNYTTVKQLLNKPLTIKTLTQMLDQLS